MKWILIFGGGTPTPNPPSTIPAIATWTGSLANGLLNPQNPPTFLITSLNTRNGNSITSSRQHLTNGSHIKTSTTHNGQKPKQHICPPIGLIISPGTHQNYHASQTTMFPGSSKLASCLPTLNTTVATMPPTQRCQFQVVPIFPPKPVNPKIHHFNILPPSPPPSPIIPE